MSSRAIFICCVVALILLHPSEGGTPGRPRSKRQIQKQSTLGALLAFSVKLSDMDKRIAAHDKTIEGQKLLISELQTKLDDKSDRIQFKRLMDLLDSRTYSMNNLLRSKRVLIDRNQRRLEDVENTFIGVERQYSQIAADLDDVKTRFDNVVVSCHRRKTGWNYRADGGISFLDRHLLSCRQDEFVQKFVLQKENSDNNSRVRYVYRCCYLVFSI